jgi:hypothetical protein
MAQGSQGIDPNKVKTALKNSGVVIPDDPQLASKLSAQLSQQGLAVQPDDYFFVSDEYVIWCKS